MKVSSREFMSYCCLALLSLMLAGTASAQTYPGQRITMVVGFAAGGFADTVARLIGNNLSERLGQPVTVENRPGAAANVAARAVANADPDGYTILVTTTAIAINATLYKKLEYSIEQLVAVAVPVWAPEALGIHPSNPSRSLKEFLNWAKGRKINFATAGVGTGSHLAIEFFFKKHANLNAVHVPFRGGAPAIQAALGNQVNSIAATLPAVSAHMKEGALVCLGVASAERAAALPDCPTFAQGGFARFEAASWVGFFVPAKTDRAIVDKLNGAVNAALDDREVLERLLKLGNTPAKRSASETARFVKSETAKWSEMVTTLGISVD